MSDTSNTTDFDAAFAAGAEAMRLAILEHLVATLPYPTGAYASTLRGGIRALPQPQRKPRNENRLYGE